MAATLKKPSREKEEAGAGNIMLDVHPLHPSRPFPNRKPNRENRIKNACFSNSHSNIALSNDKRPLFVQIPATPSASLVSTSLPVQCLRLSNFLFFRRIFPNSFLRHQILITHISFGDSRYLYGVNPYPHNDEQDEKPGFGHAQRGFMRQNPRDDQENRVRTALPNRPLHR